MANLALMIEMKSQETREPTIRRPVGQVEFKCERCGRTFILEGEITRMGTYHGKFGLNDRDEISRNTRVNF